MKGTRVCCECLWPHAHGASLALQPRTPRPLRPRLPCPRVPRPPRPPRRPRPPASHPETPSPSGPAPLPARPGLGGPGRRPPPAQTPAPGASGAPERAGCRAGEGRRLPGAARPIYLLQLPQAQFRRAGDNGASAANTPRASIRGLFTPNSRDIARTGRGDPQLGAPASPAACVPCVPGAAPACALWAPKAAGPEAGRTEISRHLRPVGSEAWPACFGWGCAGHRRLSEWAGVRCAG